MNKDYYFPTINMLRGIASLMVCLFHFTNYSDFRGDFFAPGGVTQSIGEYGKLGVYSFFIITGCVIPLSMFRHNFQLKKTHKFLFKRWIRIEIPYLISILLILCVYFAFSIKNQTPFTIASDRILHHVFYTSEFFNVQWYNPIYWTLAIEMQFYILIILLYPLINFKNPIVNCIAPLVLGGSSLFVHDTSVVLHYGAIFSQGIFLHLILTNNINKKLGYLGIILSAFITIYSNGLDIALTSIITVMLIAFTNVDRKLFNWFGDISYSLYLTHGLIGVNLIYLVSRFTEPFFLKLTLTIVALIASIFFAFVYWKIIENPSKRVSKKITLSNKT